MYLHGRCPRISITLGKNIVESGFKGLYYSFVRIDRYVSLSKKEGANIVHSRCMIGMLVGKENTVNFGDLVVQHLLPEIGATINYVIKIFPGNKYRNP
jgi:hypothetical protein